jgi:putative nucleotidyltransferase with HDIG domain
MKVLFVDDEPRILQAIERVLFDIDVDVTASFAGSGEQALELIGSDTYDVIVSDMRMPGIGGDELLARVRATQPGVMRVVLTGYADADVMLRVSQHAHQFLSKPCTPQLLTDMLRRAECMRRLMKNEALVASIGGVTSLPSAPTMWVQLNEMLASSDVMIDEAVTLIRRDPAMSAKVLQLANSAMFGARYPLSDPKVAVVRLGLKTIRGLVLAVGAFSSKTMPKKGIDLDAMQRRALEAAVLAQELCEVPAEKDTAFTAALLADIGTLLLPDAPEEELGYTHAEAGAYLLGLWGLPDGVIDAVAKHHIANEDIQVMDARASVFKASVMMESGETK